MNYNVCMSNAWTDTHNLNCRVIYMLAIEVHEGFYVMNIKHTEPYILSPYPHG